MAQRDKGFGRVKEGEGREGQGKKSGNQGASFNKWTTGMQKDFGIRDEVKKWEAK